MSRRHLAFAPVQVLLVQSRTPGSPVLEHERLCVEARLRMANTLLTTINVVEKRLVEHLAEHAEVDAMILGGAGEFSVARTPAPWLDDYIQDLKVVLMRDIPLFGICFGLQVLVVAMGGEVVHDAARAESGVGRYILTAEGRVDEVFGRLPSPFGVLTEHQDRVERLPVGVEVLARGPRVAVQAIRVAGRPIFAVQFHPELDADAMRQRQIFYRERHAGMFTGVEECGEVDGCGGEAGRLLRYFVEAVKRRALPREALPLVA